jgi:uncharacterized protein (DUF433 family)
LIQWRLLSDALPERGFPLSVTTGYQHIVINEAGTPIIAGTTMKVVELVLDHKAYGWSPEELHLQHPHLSLGQIHSALAYYWDHREEVEQEIERRLRQVNELEKTLRPTTLRERLKAKGLI